MKKKDKVLRTLNKEAFEKPIGYIFSFSFNVFWLGAQIRRNLAIQCQYSPTILKNNFCIFLQDLQIGL